MEAGLLRRASANPPQARGEDAAVESLDKLAASALQRGDYVEAERLYKSVLSLRWGAPASSSQAGVFRVLEKFAEVLSLGFIRDPRLEQGALRDFREAVSATPLNRDLYAVMRDGLMSVTLVAEAESLMQQAIVIFPNSRQLRFQLAELYVTLQRYRKAKQMFEEAIRATAHPDPAIERTQRSLIYEKIAEMNTFMADFDGAVAVTKTALEVNPQNVGSRLVLGDLYYRRDMPDEAAAEYERVIAIEPGSAAAYYGLAQVYLGLGRFAESAAAAEEALDLERNHHPARYVQAMALIRAGRGAQGKQALKDYQRMVADEQAAAAQREEVEALDRSVMGNVVDGNKEEAIRLLRQGVALQPGAALLHFKLGLLESALGQRAAAVQTFENMIRLKLDDFLVHRVLAVEYEALGKTALAQRHRAIHLQKFDAALKERLNR
jgi:tetratricopeptide (TPR) repeat protein